MTLAPHARPTAADLLRLLAAWLAAIVLVQGIAAARALGLGPLRRHSDAAAAHHHDVEERHHHAAAEASVVSSADDADFNAAAFAITAALALMALGQSRRLTDVRCHVWRAARAWAWRPVSPGLLRRPPKPRSMFSICSTARSTTSSASTSRNCQAKPRRWPTGMCTRPSRAARG